MNVIICGMHIVYVHIEWSLNKLIGAREVTMNFVKKMEL